MASFAEAPRRFTFDPDKDKNMFIIIERKYGNAARQEKDGKRRVSPRLADETSGLHNGPGSTISGRKIRSDDSAR